MTREEAIIDIRDNIKPIVADCISRQAVLDLIADYDLSMGQVVKGIHALPSVTPQELRKGHWISHREFCEKNNLRPSGLGSYFWCSNCDCGIDVREWHRNNYNFCPNCGADMRGNTKRKGEPIEGNNESYNCENWIP